MSQNIFFIPVRKNSKGIPGKNIKKLGGKPLLCWAIDSIISSKISGCIWVATDCEQTKKILYNRYNGKINVYFRSKQSAQDNSPTIDVVMEFLKTYSFKDDDRFILLQATVPFIRAVELINLLNVMQKKEYDSFIACCKIKKFSWSECGFPLSYTIGNKPRRQEYNGILLESGAYYASTVGQIKLTKELISGKVKTIEINHAGLIDIDEIQDWQLAEYYLRNIGVSNDFYLEFYNSVDYLLSEYIKEKQLPQSVRSYLFQRTFKLRSSYNKQRIKGCTVEECNSFLKEKLFHTCISGQVNSIDNNNYCKSEFWYQTLKSLRDRLLVYVYNNRQLYYLLPIINAINRPVILICEPNVNAEIEVNDNITAVELCFFSENEVYNDNTIKVNYPELYQYYNAFHLFLEALRPEGIIVLEGCHYQEQILGELAGKKNIPSIAIQQGWPSLIHSMFRQMPYSHFLSWGKNFVCELEKWNPTVKFIQVGYPYQIKEKTNESITFFLQAPLFISDKYYLSLIIDLIFETAEKYPRIPILVKEHPEYKLKNNIINRLHNYKNIHIVSDWEIADVYANTQIAVSHFSSTIIEGVVHNCIPLVFDPTRFSSYIPDVEEIGYGLISKDKISFFEKLDFIQNNLEQFIYNISLKKNLCFTEISNKSIEKIVDSINEVATCNYLKYEGTPRLQIGCGRFKQEGWLNTDISCSTPDIYYLNAAQKYPFPDNSFNYIYSEHLFEHLNINQAIIMLQECFRILKPKGKLRLSMPNFHFLMDLYLNPNKEVNRKYLDWSFTKYIDKNGINVINRNSFPIYVINNFFHNWGHKFIHTQETITEIAKSCGFINIESYTIGQSKVQEFKGIESHFKDIPEWANQLETFIVEMEK